MGLDAAPRRRLGGSRGEVLLKWDIPRGPKAAGDGRVQAMHVPGLRCVQGLAGQGGRILGSPGTQSNWIKHRHGFVMGDGYIWREQVASKEAFADAPAAISWCMDPRVPARRAWPAMAWCKANSQRCTTGQACWRPLGPWWHADGLVAAVQVQTKPARPDTGPSVGVRAEPLAQPGPRMFGAGMGLRPPSKWQMSSKSHNQLARTKGL